MLVLKALSGVVAVVGVGLVVIEWLERDELRQQAKRDVEQARCDERARAKRPEWWRRLVKKWDAQGRLGESKRRKAA